MHQMQVRKKSFGIKQWKLRLGNCRILLYVEGKIFVIVQLSVFNVFFSSFSGTVSGTTSL